MEASNNVLGSLFGFVNSAGVIDLSPVAVGHFRHSMPRQSWVGTSEEVRSVLPDHSSSSAYIAGNGARMSHLRFTMRIDGGHSEATISLGKENEFARRLALLKQSMDDAGIGQWVPLDFNFDASVGDEFEEISECARRMVHVGAWRLRATFDPIASFRMSSCESERSMFLPRNVRHCRLDSAAARPRRRNALRRRLLPRERAPQPSPGRQTATL